MFRPMALTVIMALAGCLVAVTATLVLASVRAGASWAGRWGLALDTTDA
jgi:hypothetical protein